MKELIAKLFKIQQELDAPKNLHNKFGNYKYRSCESILNAVKPLLLGLVLLVDDELIMIGDRYYIKSTVTLTDGENHLKSTAYAREGNDKKGMDDSQLTGATSSYARKYALNGLFLIDDVKDADDTNQGEKTEKKPSKPKSPKEGDNGKPWLTEELLKQGITRIKAGEADVYENMNKAFRMKKTYREELKACKSEK